MTKVTIMTQVIFTALRLGKMNLFEKFSLIIGGLTMILWGFYVFFTIKTFKEIKAQTDLQTKAFLVVRASMIASPQEKFIDKILDSFKTFNNKWQGILRTNIPDALADERQIILELNNQGRSEIVKYLIKVKCIVISMNYLKQVKNISDDHFEWEIKNNSSVEGIPPDKSIKIQIATTGYFPKAIFSWEIEFEDARQNKSTFFGGDKDIEDKNLLANPEKST